MAVGIVVIMAMVVISGCQAQIITQYNTNADSYTLKHDWGPMIVIEKGAGNSCYFTESSVSGRSDVCRVVDGYGKIGDTRNWKIEGSSPIASAGSDTGKYGRMIVLEDGQVFEGCDWRSPDNSYLCDYRIRKQVVMHLGGYWDYVLRKFWDWTGYVADAAGCATGMAGAWSGVNKITLTLLRGCADGPL